MTAALTAVAMWATTTSGATSGTVSMDAATFAFRHDSTHYSDHCDPNGISIEAENSGTVNGQGAYFGGINLPNGTRLRSFRLVVRDNDGELDTYAYLLRKRMVPQSGYDLITEQYRVLASTRSSGASMNVRRFSDTTVQSPVIDQTTYAYFVELVNCGNTVDPLGIQLTWTRG
jgi:hypothetical protein